MMTKTLTEKWKDGELEDGWYYAKTSRHDKIRFYLSRFGSLWYDSFNPINASERVEILAPVPSYKQLTDMDEELKSLACKNDTLAMENGKLQEQLKEANEIISDLSEYPPINPSTRELSNALNRHNAKKYLEKWSVK